MVIMNMICMDIQYCINNPMYYEQRFLKTPINVAFNSYIKSLVSFIHGGNKSICYILSKGNVGSIHSDSHVYSVILWEAQYD